MKVTQLLFLAFCFLISACHTSNSENKPVSETSISESIYTSFEKSNQLSNLSVRLTFLFNFFTSKNSGMPESEEDSYSKKQKLILQLVTISLTILMLLTIFLIFSRRKILISNKILAENNEYIGDLYEEIRQQFDLIKQKSEQLDLYHNKLEELVEERTKELMAAKLKARESELLKSTLISNIYHEIRTPLNAIIGFTQLLSMDEKFKNQVYLKIIDKNADDLLTLVDNLIELSKLQSGNTQIVFDKVRLKDLMESIFDEAMAAKDSQSKQKIEVVPEFEKLQPTDHIFSCPQILHKILKNLIDNALKYTDNGIISIGCNVVSDKAVFYVSDTGIGIEKEKLPTIFNAFHKIEDNNNLHRGIGIGLAISKQLSEKIDGKLYVESEFKKGTKFSLCVPA